LRSHSLILSVFIFLRPRKSSLTIGYPKVQLDALPSLISYSPLAIPLSSTGRTGPVTLARRDLFDARFQLISTEDASEPRTNDMKQALEFLDTPSDLVPGVYEGGLKTWECSLDLVDYLDGIDSGDVRGKRVLEVF
jgi:protein-histidine N-methyltransferase